MAFYSLMLIFLTSLSLSLGHCIGMCGGIVIAYSGFKRPRWWGHLAYNVGRWCSYVAIGVAFALLGKAFAISHFWRSGASLIVGILLVLYAICFAFFPKILRAIEPSKIGSFGMLSRAFGKLLRSCSWLSFFGIGVINGWLPCGLVYFFALNVLNEQIPEQILSWSAGFSPMVLGALWAVAVMSAFWLGTLAPMLSIGALGSVLSKYRKTLFVISFLFMLGLGLLNIYAGLAKI
ncbi:MULTISPECIES: sulfite exporter TauE/SafE family protein [unclassified Helicobacter]|uniref:sulfite exporter TauE/SafE family protein n=1 Tax=unclassified Helicobacter TaxID=2593540 RepID=UPI000B30DFFE|nr:MULTISPECIES: sulfite exporter TauE/SafE family protein [unclassified Helicobacter]